MAKTMIVKMKTLMSGPDGHYMPGEEITVDAKKGKELVEGNFAEEVKFKAKAPENATLFPPENTALPSAEDVAMANLKKLEEAEKQAVRESLLKLLKGGSEEVTEVALSGTVSVPVGDVLLRAFENSGFTVDEWNDLEDEDRAGIIATAIEAMKMDLE